MRRSRLPLYLGTGILMITAHVACQERVRQAVSPDVYGELADGEPLVLHTNLDSTRAEAYHDPPFRDPWGRVLVYVRVPGIQITDENGDVLLDLFDHEKGVELYFVDQWALSAYNQPVEESKGHKFNNIKIEEAPEDTTPHVIEGFWGE